MTNKKTVNRTIKSMTENHRQDALELVERVFTEFEDETEGKAVETTLQRQHISKELIEYGFQKAVEMGFEAVLVEGNPKNYHARGFRTAADYGILPGKTVHLPHIDCLMVKELKQGALKQIKGILEYDFYRALT
ncbi:MAG: hypothetical protein J6C12_11355 [Lachnospiraceae bacterium]|nr:hypothetical protein [Lachnospiraceae bacterium]